MVPTLSQASESLESFWKYILSELPHPLKKMVPLSILGQESLFF